MWNCFTQFVSSLSVKCILVATFWGIFQLKIIFNVKIGIKYWEHFLIKLQDSAKKISFPCTT